MRNETELEDLRSLLQKNKHLISNLLPKPQSRDVAIVVKDWYDSLLVWVDSTTNKMLPTEINNKILYDGSDLSTSIEYQKDFEIIETQIWQILQKFFGGGPSIIRKLTMPATPGGTSILTHPIFLEMLTHKGIRSKTCGGDWKLCDLKKYLCMNLQVSQTNFQFVTVSSHSNINNPVNEIMSVGEYYKIYGNKIKLISNYQNQLNSNTINNNSISIIQRQKFSDSYNPPSTVTIRSSSCLGVSYPNSVGLINLGNTCFFNAAMQCIVHIKPLVQYVLSSNFDVDINRSNPLGSKGEIATAFKDFLKSMTNSSKCAVNSSKFRTIVFFPIMVNIIHNK